MVFQPIIEDVFLFRDTCHVYVVRSGAEAVLVDFGNGDVLDQLAQIGIETVNAILVTHHHRDQIQGLERAAAAGIPIYVPHAEYDLIAEVDAHWQARPIFNNYNARQDRFSLLHSARVTGTLLDYMRYSFGGKQWAVLPTPGHTTGSITLWCEIDGIKVAFTGDLIAAPGKVWTISATQWAYNDVWGAAASVLSLFDLREREPDWLLPSHGEPMYQPLAAIDLLINRLHGLLRLRGQYSALLEVRLQPYKLITPHLLFHTAAICNTYVLLSESGKALLIDFGYEFVGWLAAGYDRASRRPYLYTLSTLKRQFNVEKIDVVIATHYHDDHVAGFNVLRMVEETQVWAADPVADILENPARYDLPCLWFEPIAVDQRLPLEVPISWEEYTLTLYALPGHTHYAVAIAFEVDGQKVLATGDQYQGADQLELNYVYQNHYHFGDYLLSAVLYKRVQPDIILSGHWKPFYVPPGYVEQLEVKGAALLELHRDLTLDNPHIDAADFLVRFLPYQVQAMGGEPIDFLIEVHSPFDYPTTGEMALVVPSEWSAVPQRIALEFGANEPRTIPVRITPPADFSQRRVRITADLTLGGHRFGQQAEALVSAPTVKLD